MPTIQLLDQDLINKIAAGEVVERPASVVKELLENSLDAGATQIAVEIEEGGINLMRITDNGQGMSKEDARMSIKRHATSKLRKVEDLNHLKTLGFRGEALAAISAVSQFRIVTRPDGDVGAVQVTVDSGQVEVSKASGAKGTMVEIRGLFHNVPARKKFLKAASTEFRHVVDVFTHQALLMPQVAFKLLHNSKVVADYPRVTDWAQRISMVLGKDLAGNLIEVNYQRASLKITGFIAHPSLATQSRKAQYLFVNQRPISDYLLAKAVKDGYAHNLSSDRHPSFVLQLAIDPDLVDVNVHPRKSEVKFADTRSVFREVVNSVKEALGGAAGGGQLGVEGANQNEVPFASGNTPARSQPGFSNSASTQYNLKTTPGQKAASFSAGGRPASGWKGLGGFASGASGQSGQIFRQPGVSEVEPGDWVLLGQAHDSYLIVQTLEGVMIVDQHAVAEKVLYEELLANVQTPKVQKLLVPLVFELSASQIALLEEQAETLSPLGVEGECFGGGSYRLTGLPQDLNVSDVKQFFMELLDDMAEGGLGKINSLEERQEKLLQYAACRGAVMFGDPLTYEEQIQMLKDIKKYKVLACVHGRPAMFTLSKQEMNKKFQRAS